MSRRKRRLKRRLALKMFRTLFLVLVPMLIVYSASIFLEIKKVQIVGNVPYSNLEMNEVLDKYLTQNLLLIKSAEIENDLRINFPYIDEIKITKNIPDEIMVEVTERTKFTVLESENKLWFIDKKGEVLELASFEDQYNYVRIFGVDIYMDELNIPTMSDIDKENYVNVINTMNETEYFENVKEIRINGMYDVQVLYTDNFIVKLGTDNDLLYKISVMEQFLERLTQSDTGIIDVTTPSVARFIPGRVESNKYLEEEKEPEPEVFFEMEEYSEEVNYENADDTEVYDG